MINLEKPDIGSVVRVKAFKCLTSVNALVEALDGENGYVSIWFLSLRVLWMLLESIEKSTLGPR